MSERRQPDSPARTRRPAPLVVAASLVAVEGVLVLLLAVLELSSLDASRVALALTTAVFFVGYGALLLVCARSVAGGHSWARSPIVLTQLIQLGVAWSFRSGATTAVSALLVVLAVVVLVGVFHPASLRALADPEEPASRA